MVANLMALILTAALCEPKVCFSPEGRCDKVLIQTIQQAKTSLDVQVYYLTHPDIVQAIIAARERKVAVRVIVDDVASRSKEMARELARIQKAGIPIKIDGKSGIMHSKLALIDGQCMAGGSFNFTKQASTKNDENLIILNDRKLVGAVQAQFEKRWKKYKIY